MIANESRAVALEAHECWALLRFAEVGRLAVVVDDSPDIFPVNFVVDHGAVVFRTAQGTKLSAVAHGRRVAFEADGYDEIEGIAWSVVIKGSASRILAVDELFDARYLPLFPWHAAPKHEYVRITPEVLTGRRFYVVDRSVRDTGQAVRRSVPE